MGNTNTSLVDRASGSSTCCLVIEPQSTFPRGNRGLVDTTRPPNLDVDDALWAEVVEAIDPLARRLNTGSYTARVLYTAIIGVFVGLVVFGVIQQINEDGPPLVLLVLFIVVWVSIPLYIGTTMYIHVVQNRRVDNQIRQLMEGWKYRFECGGAGYSLDYRSQHTGLCKPNHARSERILAFVPIEHGVENSNANNAAVATKRPETLSDESNATNTSIDIEMDAGLAGSTQGLSLVEQLHQDDTFC